MTVDADVLVVGSGFGAAAPALRLAQSGRRVQVLERGHDLVPHRDLKQTADPAYFAKWIEQHHGDDLSLMSARAFGGASAFYFMISLRTPGAVFERTDERGRRWWPAGLDRAALNPWYDLAEATVGVRQLGVDELPRTGVIASQLFARAGLTCERGRYAVGACVGSGYCMTGCLFGAKHSLHQNYWPMAKGAGAVVTCEVDVAEIHRERDVYVVTARDGASWRAPTVVLAAGTVGTAAILGASRSLPIQSRLVGERVALNGSVEVVGLLPEDWPDVDNIGGLAHSGVVSYGAFRERGITLSAFKAHPVMALSRARLTLRGDDDPHGWWGVKLRSLMKQYRRRMIVLYALGLTEPKARLIRRGGRTHPHVDVDPRLDAYLRDTTAFLEGLITRPGGRIVDVEAVDGRGHPWRQLHLNSAHMTGSARMADSPDDGVTDAFGEVYGCPGLYVTDGAAIPSSLAVNPSLTVLANAERVADHLVRRG